MIEIKKREIVDLEDGDKFECEGQTCMRVENGYVIMHDVHAIGHRDATSLPSCFKDIKKGGFFIYKTVLRFKVNHHDAMNLETGNYTTFNQEWAVQKVHRMVVIV